MNTIASGSYNDGEYKPVNSDDFAKNVEIDSNSYCTQLWDTPCESDEKMSSTTYDSTDIFVICFSLVSKETLDNASKWVSEIRSYCPQVLFILCGTKLEVRDHFEDYKDENSPEDFAPISDDEVQKVAQELGAAAFINTSAREMTNLKELLEAAVRAVIQKPTQSSNKCAIL